MKKPVMEAIDIVKDLGHGASKVQALKGVTIALAPGELTLLEPFRKELPPEVFGPPYVAASTGGDARALRQQLLQARALLEAAGWKIAPDGKLRNGKGEAFEFEYLAPGDSVNDPRLAGWARNLAKLGISFKVRNVDFALYSRRLEE